MKWAFVGALLVTAVVIGYLLYNYYSNIRPTRETKLAEKLPPNGELVLRLIARVNGHVGTTLLLRELKGLKDVENILQAILADLRKKGCISQVDKTHHRCTGRGRRVAAILVARKRQRTKS